MTTTRAPEALEVYVQYPLDDGDAVLLLDGSVCLELEQPGRAENREGSIEELVHTVRASSSTALLAVARAGRRPRPVDLLLWTDLCAGLVGSGVELRPLVLLPAAPSGARPPAAAGRLGERL